MLNKVLDYDEVKKLLGIPEDARVVDESGINSDTNYFGIMAKKDEETITSAFEVKSSFVDNKDSLWLEGKLEDAEKALRDRFSKVSSMKEPPKLPEDGYYAVEISFTMDGEIYIRWKKIPKNELIGGG